jgi:hypothetical protein
MVMDTGSGSLFWTCRTVVAVVPGLEEITSETGEVVILTPCPAAKACFGKTDSTVTRPSAIRLSLSGIVSSFFIDDSAYAPILPAATFSS